jgi:hypothetical protein
VRHLARLIGILGLLGCQEKLTSPADCPALCPGGEPQVLDEVLTPIMGADSSFRGYVQSFNAPALLVSSGLRGYEERAIIRFPRRADSVNVRDTLRTYVIDSVAFGLTLLARDTNSTSLQVQLYRLPSTLDTTTTYAQVDPSFVPENLVTTIAVPDSVNSGALRAVLQGADLARVVIPPADGGVLGLGVRIEALAPTGVRLGSVAGGTGAVFTTYATLNIPDTGTAAKLRSFALTAAFSSTLSAVQQTDDSTLLTVGGEPSSRALLRFDLPPRIRDSATVVRATLELTPITPIPGLPTDPVRLGARAVLADLGAKSPVDSRSVGVDTLAAGTFGTVDIEIVRLMQQLWLGTSSRPTALVLSLSPELEAASFSRLVFYSTRASDPALRPRLRVSYLQSFPFENP